MLLECLVEDLQFREHAWLSKQCVPVEGDIGWNCSCLTNIPVTTIAAATRTLHTRNTFREQHGVVSVVVFVHSQALCDAVSKGS